jgi:hypothetical protein
MEALAAVGLASNILGFIESGCRVLTTAYQLSQSQSGSLSSNHELELLADNLKKTMKSVQNNYNNCHSELMNNMSPMISSCIELCDELLQILGSLKVDPTKSSLLQSLKASLQTHRKAKEIQNLDHRLERLRSQICDQLNLALL